MSDLQISLLMIGAVVVGAVFIYNWIQERGLRRRVQQSFGEAHDDVLLKTGRGSTPGDGRLEPQFGAAGQVRMPEPPHAAADADGAAAGFDGLLDYVAEITAE